VPCKFEGFWIGGDGCRRWTSGIVRILGGGEQSDGEDRGGRRPCDFKGGWDGEGSWRDGDDRGGETKRGEDDREDDSLALLDLSFTLAGLA